MTAGEVIDKKTFPLPSHSQSLDNSFLASKSVNGENDPGDGIARAISKNKTEDPEFEEAEALMEEEYDASFYPSLPVKLTINEPQILQSESRTSQKLQPHSDSTKKELSYAHFPKYRRQYKVESIYVNDLYTLTYDQGETLESLKAIEVHYVS